MRYDDTTGAFIDTFVSPGNGLDGPRGLAIGPDGNLYVSSINSDQVKRYDGTTGAFIDNFVSPGNGLDAPEHLVFRSDGFLYVDGFFSNNVLRYNATTGAFVSTFVASGSGGLTLPDGMKVGPDGNLYVVSVGSTAVLRYNGSTGAFMGTFVSFGLSQPRDIAFGPDGNLYVTNFTNHTVTRYNGSTGAFINTFVTSGSGGLSGPRGLAFGPDGHLYVASLNNGRVIKYNGTTGAFMSTFVSSVSFPSVLLFHNFDPTTPADSNGAANSVAEGATNGTAVGITVVATDVDSSTITYSLTDSAGGRFAIHPTTGVVTVSNGSLLNFEDATSHGITVQASDGEGGTSTANFTISVTNANPTTPVDVNGAANSVAEGAANGTAVGITASSTDPNGRAGGFGVIYSLTNSAGGRFAINSSTGVVTVANGSLLDGPAAHSITVQASDGAGGTSTAGFTINVTNVDPIASFANGGAVNEGSTGNVSFSGPSDVFSDATAGFHYAYDFNNDGIFEIGNGTYAGSVAATSETVPATYLADGPGTRTVRGRIIDKDGGFTDYTTTITINNVAPSFDAGPDEILPPSAAGAFSHTGISFSDPGADVWSGTVNYGDGSGNQALSVNQLAKTFDLGHTYATSGTYLVSVTLQDDDGGSLSDSFQVTVQPPVVQFSAASFQAGEGAGNSMVVQLNKSGGSLSNSVVQVSITGGTAVGGVDYNNSSFPLNVTFGPSDTVKAVTIPITQESLVELDESIGLQVTPVTNASIGPQSSATLTILNDDSGTLDLADASASEGGLLTFTVSLSAPADAEVVVAVSTGDGTAQTADGDYTPSTQTLTLAAGQTSHTFTVSSTADNRVELDESFSVTLALLDDNGRSISVADGSAGGTILNDDFLGGRVFNDRDNDGVFEIVDGDSGIADVTMQLVNQATSVVVATTTTALDGTYSFNLTPPAGTYLIVEVVDELADLGLLDGKETPGSNGGTVDNTQDSNTIRDIVVGGAGPAAPAVDYLFAEIEPSDVMGSVWEDFNHDGDINFGEAAIDAVMIELTGKDDRGQVVALTAFTSSLGIYGFADLRPSDENGYTIRESQPAGYIDGKDSLGTVNGSPVGDDSVNDEFRQVVIARPGSIAENYNFGERPAAGGAVSSGQTATIGFWQNKNGQALIRSVNGGPQSTQLADWLAATFPNMYGSSAGSSDLTGMTNDQVAEFYKMLFRQTAKTSPGGPPKLDAQVLAVSLAVYLTNQTLAGNVAEDFGFVVTQSGVGAATFDVGDANRAAFGLSPTDSTVLTVMDILLATSAQTSDGLLYDVNDSDSIDSFERSLREMASIVYTAINEQGDI